MAERFKFVRELQLSNADKYYKRDSTELSQGRLVYCHFSNVKEQTPNSEGKPFKNLNDSVVLNAPCKRDQRCYFKDNTLKIYSRGGSEFVVPIHFEVTNVFPIEDGIIVKALHNKDLIQFDPFPQEQETLRTSQKDHAFSYFTLTSHPLDDINPLSLGGQRHLIDTHIDILYVSYKLPFVVLYNWDTKHLSLGLLKNNSDEGLPCLGNNQEEEDSYIKSIESESRHPLLYNVAKDSRVQIQEIHSCKMQQPPDQIILQKGIVNPYELVVGLCFSSLKQLHFLSCDLRQPKKFQTVKVLEKVQSVSQMNFTRLKQGLSDRIKVISKALKHQLEDVLKIEANLMTSNELKFLKQRLKFLTKDIVLTDTEGKTIQFYQGYHHVLSIDLMQQLNRLNDQAKAPSLPKNIKIDKLTNPHKSNITVNFCNGESKRVKFEFLMNDFLVQSILKSFKAFLPEQMYVSLIQDTIEGLSKNNIELQRTGADAGQDQFTKFASILLSIASGEPQTVHQKQQQQFTAASQQSQLGQQQPAGKPATSLQPKILRSSVTNIGSDNTNKRKLVTTATQSQRSSLRVSMGTQKKMTSGSSEPQTFSSSLHAASSYQAISSNPFADLLNSDFHKENFNCNFKSLFPANVKLQVPMTSSNNDGSSALTLSPNKPISSKVVPQNQKIASSKQSNVLGQPERKSSVPSSQVTSPISQAPLAQVNYRTSKQDFLLHAQNIFIVLHLLYEDLKLNKLRDSIESPKLARLLVKLALTLDPLKKAAFIDYYLKEHPSLQQEFESMIKKQFKGDTLVRDGIEIDPVPKLYRWLEACLKKSSSVLVYPFPLFFERTRKLCRLYEILSDSQCRSIFSPLLEQHDKVKIDLETLDDVKISQLSSLTPNTAWLTSYTSKKDYLMMGKFRDLHLFEKVLFGLKEENLSLEEVKKLPSIISLPILEIIRYARLFQQEIQSISKWPDSLYKLIHREDILNNLRLFQRASSGSVKKQFQSLPSFHFQRQESKKFALHRGLTDVFKGQTQEEIQQETQRKEMETNILQTAADLMDNGHDINQKDKLQDDKEEGQVPEFLKNRFNQDTRYKEVQNILSSSIDMIIKLEHIPNHESLPEDKIHLEKILLLEKQFLRHLSKCAGRGAIGFGTQQTIPTETLHIPKVSQTGYVPQTESYMSVEYKDEAGKDIMQWPEFHNGVASALRIAQSLKNRKDTNQQHTRNWIMYHKPAEPKYEHGGFLLAIGLLGQLDTLQPTDIYQHLKSTHDATAIGILLGRSASKIGTMDDHDTRTLCIHIPYLLPPSLSIDISLSIQSAAVIGAGLLYKGTSNRLMTEMLLAQIGRRPLSDKAIEREGYALASGIALGLVNLGVGSEMQGISDLKLNERLIRFVEGGKTIDLPQSMLSTNFNHDNTKCSSIKEGDMVNIHITSPGALIALALIHLKSNNEQIASKLLMPQTFFSLESVRPSFLLQKVLCKNLIMWDSIKCTREWVFSQIPTIVKEIYENDITTIEKKFSQQISEDEIDYSTIALCYVNIIAGAVFSLGFKYAGTGNKEVFNLISEFTQFFRKLKIMQANKDHIGVIHTNFTKNQVDKNTVETCLCVSAFAMSIVMAGTGDIECFRVLRVLRKRFEHDMHYGFNMAIHMSLGFLFLGSGAFTFSRNNLAIAVLLCSLYPVFPQNPTDNRYHLQALRHFYVLAIETRLLQARDIDSGEFVNISLKVEVEENDTQGKKQLKKATLQTPAIINGRIKKIEVDNDQYHYINLELQLNEDQLAVDTDISEKKDKVFNQSNLQQIIFVKQKAAAMTNANSKAHKQKREVNFQDMINLNEEQAVKDLSADSQSLIEKTAQIKDPSIEMFIKSFVNFDNCTQSFPEIEDVILAQSREMFSQLSVHEFFRLQDLYEFIKGYMKQQVVPDNIKRKLISLKSIQESYMHDKLEATHIFLELLEDRLSASHQGVKRVYEQRLMAVYQDFIQVRTYQQLMEKGNSILDQENKLSKHQDLVKEAAVEYIASFGEKILLSQSEQRQRIAMEALGMLDPHEIQIAKFMVSQILNPLIKQGEKDLIDQYIAQKIDGNQTLGGPLGEINESLKMTIQHLFQHQITDLDFIDNIMLPGLLRA